MDGGEAPIQHLIFKAEQRLTSIIGAFNNRTLFAVQLLDFFNDAFICMLLRLGEESRGFLAEHVLHM